MGHILQWRVAADDHLVEGCLSCALLLDLTALSVNEPTRDRCVRPPSHQRAMCVFRPRSLVNSRVHDSHLCTRLSFATSASVVALVRFVLWMCITMLFLAEMIIAASEMEPAASDVTRTCHQFCVTQTVTPRHEGLCTWQTVLVRMKLCCRFVW